MAETHQQMLLLIKEDDLPDMNQASFAAWNVIASTRHSSFVRERTDWLETGETDKAQSCAMSTFTSHPRRTNAKEIHNGGPILLERHWTPLLLAQQTSKPFSNENGTDCALQASAL